MQLYVSQSDLQNIYVTWMIVLFLLVAIIMTKRKRRRKCTVRQLSLSWGVVLGLVMVVKQQQ